MDIWPRKCEQISVVSAMYDRFTGGLFTVHNFRFNRMLQSVDDLFVVAIRGKVSGKSKRNCDVIPRALPATPVRVSDETGINSRIFDSFKHGDLVIPTVCKHRNCARL